MSKLRRARPNPSLKRSANVRPRWHQLGFASIRLAQVGSPWPLHRLWFGRSRKGQITREVAARVHFFGRQAPQRTLPAGHAASLVLPPRPRGQRQAAWRLAGSSSGAGRVACTVLRGLTPRSSGAPTAGHQAPATGTVYILCRRGLASHRRRSLSSNVRPRKSTRVGSCRDIHQLHRMHTLSSIAAAQKAGKFREQAPRLKARRVQALKPASRVQVSFAQRQCAEDLIGQLCDVAAYTSSAQHRGKAPRLASSCSSGTLAAFSCSLPAPSTK